MNSDRAKRPPVVQTADMTSRTTDPGLPAPRGQAPAQRQGARFEHPSAREFAQAVEVTEFHGTLPDELRAYFVPTAPAEPDIPPAQAA